MNKPIDYLLALMRHPVNGGLEAWRTYWVAKGQSWRTRPEIDEERQRDLVQRLTTMPSIEKGIYPFRSMCDPFARNHRNTMEDGRQGRNALTTESPMGGAIPSR